MFVAIRSGKRDDRPPSYRLPGPVPQRIKAHRDGGLSFQLVESAFVTVCYPCTAILDFRALIWS
jgi:hypothetical protein